MGLQNKYLHKTMMVFGTGAVAFAVSEGYRIDSSLQPCVAGRGDNCLTN